MSVLNAKLGRDLRRLGGQLLTIALVVASGVAAFVTMRSAHQSLVNSQSDFYESSEFADLFVQLSRAPESLRERIRAIDGIASVETRIVERGSMPMVGMTEPASMTLVSLPERHNRLFLREGRLPSEGRREEVVISDAFAEAHHLALGDALSVLVGGVRQSVQVVGVGLSPEHVIDIDPGAMTIDARKSGVLYMHRAQLAATLDLDGAFNNVTIRLLHGAVEEDIIDRLELLLRPYGGLGVVTRERQMSNYMLNQELAGIGAMVTTVPPLFLLIAAFLLHVVLSRLIQLQRPQIATLKALGYRQLQIGVHYLWLALVIVLLGAVVGVLLGAWMTGGMVELYGEYFRFPELQTAIDPATTIIAISVSATAALVGTFTSIRAVLVLPPAEAMRPAAPSKYGKGYLSRLPFLGPAARMVFREVERRPLRLLLSALAISVSVALIVVGQFFADAMSYLGDTYMHESQRWDMQVTFSRPRPANSLRAFESLPGVHHVEGLRRVPVNVRHEHITRSIALTLYPEGGELEAVLDDQGVRTPIPERGAMVTALLADRLGLSVGDTLELEILQGSRQTLEVPVVALSTELFGMNVHMSSPDYHRIAGEEPSITSVLLAIDTERSDELDRRIMDLPDVVGISHMERVLQQFKEQSASNIAVMSIVMALFACIICIGVVYNNARVALSMRSRDLASLRVLGFTRGEIAGILVGELSLQVLLAVPIGLFLGNAMAYGMANGAADPEFYRLPVVISTRTYLVAILLTLASSLFSAWLVRRKLYALDLIGVLKTRD